MELSKVKTTSTTLPHNKLEIVTSILKNKKKTSMLNNAILNFNHFSLRSFTSINMNSVPAIVSRILVFSVVIVISDPQINLLNRDCNQYKVTDPSVFLRNLNATFSDLREQLSNGSNKFATAQQPTDSDPVFSMVQCRNYLNRSDCIQCFDAAADQIRSCSPSVGARVVYDGCFLRYQSSAFFDETTTPGNIGICSNRTVPQGTAFAATVAQLLSNLLAVTPKINGYFAALDQPVGNTGGTFVYAIAQCANTVSQTGCRDCLTAAYNNIESCPPIAEARGVDAGCFLRYSDVAFFDTNQTTDITSLLGNGGSTNNKAIIGAVVGGVVFILLAVMFVIWLKVYRRKAKREHRGDILGATELKGLKNYEYKDLAFATKNFSEENKLGEGGFGDVYKGTLQNGNVVAVKKLAIGQSIRAKADFENEVTLISNVHHRNLIRLLGCCNKAQELLLVYEYMANSSLDKFLFGEKKGTLNWKQRLDIIIGTARGLAYLHEEFHVCIIHRDIKSNNILLDDDFQPKIADFGLARLLPEDKTHINTRFAGTLGYTAPEYAIQGQLSPKVDTYSFGVVLLEIISGCRSNDVKLEPDTQYLLQWVWRLYEDDKLMNLVDESLDQNEYEPQQIKKVIEIALLCTQSSAVARPTMSEVIVFLLSKGNTEFRPIRPTFIDSVKGDYGDTSNSTTNTTASLKSNVSKATVSFTEVSGR